MPRSTGPRLVVSVPEGQVWEPLREDVAGQVERFEQVLAHIPMDERVWEVRV